MRIIFLDVDGVLNNDKTEDRIFGWIGIDPKLLNNLKRLYDESNKEEETRIVVSSSWKNDEVRSKNGYTKADNCYAELLKRLNSLNMEVLGYTTETRSQSERGEGILRWIKEYNGEHEQPISTYVVLDDEEFDFENHEDLYKRFVHTSRFFDKEEVKNQWWSYVAEGLIDKHVEKALKILRGEFGENVGES